MHSSLTKKSDVKPVVGIIANSTSQANRLDLIKFLGEPHDGFFNPLKFHFEGMAGEIIALDIQPNEVLSKSGMIKAKEYALNAVAYLVSRGVKVICFTASTKRLPGKSGKEVKAAYPDIVFSIGDNATMISYLSLIDKFSENLNVEVDNVACLGAGFLGVSSVEDLVTKGFKNISLITEQKLSDLPESVKTFDSLDSLGVNNKLFLSCSHKYELNPLVLRNKLAKQAVILDAAVPPGISREVYRALVGIKRYDAGDFFLDDIIYHFPPKILSFPKAGFWFGCFTEAVVLARAIERGTDLSAFNFFEVNDFNLQLLRSLLSRHKFSVPTINFFEE